MLGRGADADVAQLLVTELVTNAVVHARSEVCVGVSCSGPRIRVEVADDCPLPPRPRVPGLDDTTGRGLLLVEALAAAWGSDATDAGKTVWFELSEAGSV